MAKALLAMGSAAAVLSSRSISYFNRAPSLVQSKQTVFHKDLCMLFPVSNLSSPVPLGVVAVACRRNFSIRATNGVTDSGSVDSSLIRSMEKKIKEQLPAESVAVKDAYGDGRHVSIDVISSAFEGQSPLNRQRMVYKVIWEELQSTVHAVDQMTTRTPIEASA